MSADTLVLNKSFYAIQIIQWQRSMSLLWQGHAEAVDENYITYDFDSWSELSKTIVEHPSGFIHTPTLRLVIPEVIRLTRYEKLPDSDVKFTRSNLYSHYKNLCSYCGDKFSTKELNLDHVIPRSRGGKTTWDNIVLSCIECNLRKADRTPREADMKLLVNPTRPKWKGHQNLILRSPVKIKMSWQKFVDNCYWNSELSED